MSVYPSICPPLAGILVKQLNISSNFFQHRVHTLFYTVSTNIWLCLRW